jgi:hypothetical protein
MTAGELLDSALSFPFHPRARSSKIGHLSLSRRIQTTRAWPAEV